VTSATSRAGTAYHPRVHVFTPGVRRLPVIQSLVFYVMFCGILFVFLLFVLINSH